MQQSQTVLSALLDRRPEYVRVQAVIITELELGDIERQIFLGFTGIYGDRVTVTGVYGDMIHIAEYQRAQTFHGAVNSAIRIMSP